VNALLPQDEPPRITQHSWSSRGKSLESVCLAAMAGVAVGLIGFIIFFATRFSGAPMELLYGNLSPQDAREISQQLQSDGTPFQTAEDGTEIHVASDLVTPIRMQMAELGLPAGGSIGYEVFDDMDSLGATNFMQNVNLVRAVQDREINRVGSNASVKIDVRILATSNHNMEAEVKAGKFREDLFFRLNVVKLTVPPLRNRPKDIDVLAKHFAQTCAEENAVPVRTLTPDAIAALQAHRWPGNVRELENTVHRAVLLAACEQIGADAIMLTDDDGNLSEDAKVGIGGLVGRTVADVERDLIIDTLKHTLGNRTHAAKILGISIRTLRNKLNTYVQDGTDVPAPGTGET
jgi:hypothetical protein